MTMDQTLIGELIPITASKSQIHEVPHAFNSSVPAEGVESLAFHGT